MNKNPYRKARLSKKQRAKAQSDLYRIFLQRLKKKNKRYHIGRYTQPTQTRTQSED